MSASSSSESAKPGNKYFDLRKIRGDEVATGGPDEGPADFPPFFCTGRNVLQVRLGTGQTACSGDRDIEFRMQPGVGINQGGQHVNVRVEKLVEHVPTQNQRHNRMGFFERG